MLGAERYGRIGRSKVGDCDALEMTDRSAGREEVQADQSEAAGLGQTLSMIQMRQLMLQQNQGDTRPFLVSAVLGGFNLESSYPEPTAPAPSALFS